jgi:2-C-methyl-D-erythritol 4-phosphate cytidylyltransferase
MSMKTLALIPAGGSGKRISADRSKQYLLIEGIPILAYTLKVFQESPVIDAILIIAPPGDISNVKNDIVERYNLSKVENIVPGGLERQDSVWNGLRGMGKETDIVLIHDGVRPFVTDTHIRTSIEEAIKYDAVTLGIPSKDTVKHVNSDGWIVNTLNRSELRMIQTPQTFRRHIIQQAYQKAYDDDFYGTDDAMLVERLGIPVKVIEGSYGNLKITTREDLLLAEAIIKARRKT